jgi:serine/threonine-protein kinase
MPFAPHRNIAPEVLTALPAGYELLAVLEQGAFSLTLAVRGPSGEGVCKRLTSRARTDEAAVQALRDEAALLAALDGRAAPRLRAEGEDDRGPFVVMERVPGVALLEAFAGHGGAVTPLAFDNIARAAFGALAVVHEAADARGPLGIVHADLSPRNVLVDAITGAPRVTVVDFGLSHWRDARAMPAAAGAYRGTARYAAPEAARGEAIDPRADLFSLAASLLHAATGHAPRAGLDGAALLVAAGEVPLDLTAAFATAPFAAERPAWRARLAACLAFAPDARPRSAREVCASD